MVFHFMALSKNYVADRKKINARIYSKQVKEFMQAIQDEISWQLTIELRASRCSRTVGEMQVFCEEMCGINIASIPKAG